MVSSCSNFAITSIDDLDTKNLITIIRSHELIQNYWNKTVRNKVNYGLTLEEVEKYLK